MSGLGTLEVDVTMRPDGTIFFTEVANETEGAVAFDGIARQFVAYQGVYTYQITATNFDFADPAVHFPDGMPDNVSWCSLNDKVVQVKNANRIEVGVQKVSFVVHPLGPQVDGDPTILNNPLPPPGGGQALPMKESAVTDVVTH
jgi:hypothetical protein